MTVRFKFLSVVVATTLLCSQVQAQSLRPTPGAGESSVASRTATSDFIVAVVNSEPVTNNEVQREVQRMQQLLATQRRPAPDLQRLNAEALERLITQKALLQFARESGIRVEDAAIDQAEQSIAAQNQMTLAQLRKQLEAEGMSQSQFRNQLRDQILMQRLRERDLDSRVRVSETDIDAYLQAQQNTQDASQLEINLAQILIAVPEAASAD